MYTRGIRRIGFMIIVKRDCATFGQIHQTRDTLKEH